MSEMPVHTPSGSVKLPGVGPVPKKWFVIVGGGSAIVIGYVYWKRRGTSTAMTPTGAGASLAGQPCTDANGIPGVYDDSGICQVDQAAAGGFYAGQGAGGVSGVTPPVPGTGGFTTNGQWTQQAEADLQGIGIDGVTLSAALGAYVAGRPLTVNQQGLVDQAIAAEGYPPVAGPSGYPPAMHVTATPVPVPAPKPGPKPAAHAGAITGLKVTGYNRTGVSFAWHAATGATQGYGWILTGNGIRKTGSTKATHVSVTGLKKPGVYNFGIQALPGGPGANIRTPHLKG